MSYHFIQKPSDQIDPHLLTSPIFSGRTKDIAPDSSVSIWICKKKGNYFVEGGIYGEQTIKAKKFPKKAYRKIQGQLEKIDLLTGLSVNIVKNREDADIKLFLDREIDLGPDGSYDGICVFNYNKKQKNNWEIFLSGKNIKSTNYLVYASLHEIQHTLGLEHPHDDSDKDFYLSTSANKSAEPHQTLMSYRSPRWKIYPNIIPLNDIKALQSIWGEATIQTNSLISTTKPRKPSVKKPNSDDMIFIDFEPGNDFVIRGYGENGSLLRFNLFNQLIGETNVNKRGNWKFQLDGDLLQLKTPFTGAILEIQQLDPFGHLTSTPAYSLIQT